jgi:hypothetical protein
MMSSVWDTRSLKHLWVNQWEVLSKICLELKRELHYSYKLRVVSVKVITWVTRGDWNYLSCDGCYRSLFGYIFTVPMWLSSNKCNYIRARPEFYFCWHENYTGNPYNGSQQVCFISVLPELVYLPIQLKIKNSSKSRTN